MTTARATVRGGGSDESTVGLSEERANELLLETQLAWQQAAAAILAEVGMSLTDRFPAQSSVASVARLMGVR